MRRQTIRSNVAIVRIVFNDKISGGATQTCRTSIAQKIFIKRPLSPMGSVRMPPKIIALMREAAMVEGISQSELLRRATEAEARILRRQKRLARLSTEIPQAS
jgi:hypothetical protein